MCSSAVRQCSSQSESQYSALTLDTGLTRKYRATRQARACRLPYHYPLPGLQRAEAYLVPICMYALDSPLALLTRFLHEARVVLVHEEERRAAAVHDLEVRECVSNVAIVDAGGARGPASHTCTRENRPHEGGPGRLRVEGRRSASRRGPPFFTPNQRGEERPHSTRGQGCSASAWPAACPSVWHGTAVNPLRGV